MHSKSGETSKIATLVRRADLLEILRGVDQPDVRESLRKISYKPLTTGIVLFGKQAERARFGDQRFKKPPRLIHAAELR